MESKKKNSELFKLAIDAEMLMGDFYLGLMKKFNFSESSDFFKEMASQEIEHMQKLTSIRNKLSESELLAPANPVLLEEAKSIQKFSLHDELDAIENLEDAHKKMQEIELSEVNTVFSFLLSEFVPSDERRTFEMDELKEHLKKIEEFKAKYLEP
jgi:rubrerythrin